MPASGGNEVAPYRTGVWFWGGWFVSYDDIWWPTNKKVELRIRKRGAKSGYQEDRPRQCSEGVRLMQDAESN